MGLDSRSAAFVNADGMVFVVLAIVIVWKAVKRTRFYRGHEVDLTSDLQDIHDYTEHVSRTLRDRAIGTPLGLTKVCAFVSMRQGMPPSHTVGCPRSCRKSGRRMACYVCRLPSVKSVGHVHETRPGACTFVYQSM